MHPTTAFYATLFLTATSLLLVVPAASAQDRSPAAPSTAAPSATAPGPTTSPANISDSKLDATAAAVKNVSAITDTYKQKLAKAPAGEKDRLVREADTAMTKAITDQGLTVDEYTKIIQVAQNDPVVRDKLLQRLNLKSDR